MSSPGLTGQPSIPEAGVLNREASEILDRPLSRAIQRRERATAFLRRDRARVIPRRIPREKSRAQGMPGAGRTHRPPATRKAGGSDQDPMGWRMVKRGRIWIAKIIQPRRTKRWSSSIALTHPPRQSMPGRVACRPRRQGDPPRRTQGLGASSFNLVHSARPQDGPTEPGGAGLQDTGQAAPATGGPPQARSDHS